MRPHRAPHSSSAHIDTCTRAQQCSAVSAARTLSRARKAQQTREARVGQVAAVATVQYRRWRVPVGAQCCVHVQWVSGALARRYFPFQVSKVLDNDTCPFTPVSESDSEWLYHVPLRSLTVGMEKPCPAHANWGRAGRARRTQPATNALRHRRALVRSLRTREERRLSQTKTAAFDGLRSHAPLYIPDDASGTLVSVSYTHLTLPTKRIV